MGKIVSIDYGLARIGVAISDPTHLIARSLEVVAAHKKMELNINSLKQLLKGDTIDKIIVGLPLKMNGQPGTLTAQIEIFIEQLKQEFTCPIITWDERLTTVQAERAMREASMSRKKRAKVIDAVSAVIILQTYLDFLHKQTMGQDKIQ